MAWDRDKEKKAAKNMNIATSVFAIVFLVIWTAIAPSFMKLFGLAGLGLVVYRFYAFLQLSKEEKKPQNEIEPWDRPAIEDVRQQEQPAGRFCPYCGFALQEGFAFCPKCGRKQP